MTKKQQIIVAVILVALGVATRLLPHPANFTPLAAIAMFSGFYFSKKIAIALPAVAMLIGDIFIGFYEWPVMISVYVCFILSFAIGRLVKKFQNATGILSATLGGSVVFYLVTNWAVWQFSPWYAKTFSGLINCYIAALPFFRNTLMGDIFFSGVLFGAYFWIKYQAGKTHLAPASVK